MKKIAIAILIPMYLSCAPMLGDTMKVIITSTSPQKNAAVMEVFERVFSQDTVELISYKSDSGVPSQPVGCEVALKGAMNRIDSLPRELLFASQYVVSIENFIEPFSDSWRDVGLVVLKDLSKSLEETVVLTRSVLIPSRYVNLAKEMSDSVVDEGFSVTVGKAIQKSLVANSIDSQDWHREKEFGGMSRKDLLEEALFKALYKDEIFFLKNRIRTYENFPKPGILFEDFFPILSDKEAFQQCVDLLYEWYKDKNIEVIVGLESRGFILGSALAYKLGVGFVPVRKPGKLPGLNHSVSYKKEYGVDTLVIAQSALELNQRVLIVDDLIATGGSAKAAIELVQLAGGTPIEFFSLLEVKGLEGRMTLGIPSFNLID